MARSKPYNPESMRIGRTCIVCGRVFALSHPSDPRLLCEVCQPVLVEIIKERIEKENDS